MFFFLLCYLLLKDCMTTFLFCKLWNRVVIRERYVVTGIFPWKLPINLLLVSVLNNRKQTGHNIFLVKYETILYLMLYPQASENRKLRNWL